MAPIGAAIVTDAVVHSIPGINVLLGLLSEPVGAAAGVAYMMSLVLSAPSVDPKTLAPEVSLRFVSLGVVHPSVGSAEVGYGPLNPCA